MAFSRRLISNALKQSTHMQYALINLNLFKPGCCGWVIDLHQLQQSKRAIRSLVRRLRYRDRHAIGIDSFRLQMTISAWGNCNIIYHTVSTQSSPTFGREKISKSLRETKDNLMQRSIISAFYYLTHVTLLQFKTHLIFSFNCDESLQVILFVKLFLQLRNFASVTTLQFSCVLNWSTSKNIVTVARGRSENISHPFPHSFTKGVERAFKSISWEQLSRTNGEKELTQLRWSPQQQARAWKLSLIDK